MPLSFLTWQRTPSFTRFFFPSRRRHTRSKRAWSSDVCSSDLPDLPGGGIRLALAALHVALGEAPVTAVVPGEQVFPPPLRHPPDHRAAGFFLRRFVKYAAV